jgi:GAF domain-containing protein/HAMP domain-containing protein
MKTLSSGLDEIGEFVKTIQDTPVSQARLEAGNPSEFSVAGYVLFNNNWKVIVGIPVQTFASTLVNQTRNTVIIGLVIVLAVVFAASITANLLTSPLNELAQITAEIGRGNLEVSAKSDRLDEIGILSNVFDQTSTELRLVLSDLERRVAEQTSELAASNKTNARRAEQLRSIAEIAQSVTGLQDIETLLPQITDKISKVLGFYHVGIFLLDPNKQFAVLRAANSEGGKKMLAREHKLKVGQVGIVGFVTSTGQSRIALDVGEDAVFFNNPDLPLTRSEIALPFKIGEEIIGALDVQSTESNAFSAQDVDILSLLADQVSIAIQNSRLFEETRRALAEAQLLYSESLSSSWKAFASEENLNFRYTNGKVEILGTQKAAKMDGKTSALEMDIAIRGKTLGKLHIEVPDKNRKWTDGEMRLYRAIVERLAFTLENARLFRDARKLASKEQLIGEITSKIGASVNMDNILQTAVEQLSMAIPDSEIIIQFREEENKLES